MDLQILKLSDCFILVLYRTMLSQILPVCILFEVKFWKQLNRCFVLQNFRIAKKSGKYFQHTGSTFSSDTRQSMKGTWLLSDVSYSDECRTNKYYQYAENRFPLFFAILKFRNFKSHLGWGLDDQMSFPALDVTAECNTLVFFFKKSLMLIEKNCPWENYASFRYDWR